MLSILNHLKWNSSEKTYHANTTSFEIINSFLDWWWTIFWLKGHCKLSSSWNNKISCLVLITKSVTSNDNWFIPSCNQSGDVVTQNWFTEYGSTFRLIQNTLFYICNRDGKRRVVIGQFLECFWWFRLDFSTFFWGRILQLSFHPE